MNPQTSDLVGFSNAVAFSHGCTNWATAKIVGIQRTKAKVYAQVIKAESCHSCWQVGHDADYTFCEVGDLVEFPYTSLQRPTDSWSADVQWEADDWTIIDHADVLSTFRPI